MRISRRRPPQRRVPQQQTFGKYRVNQFIRVPQVRVIDENNQNIGVMDTTDALARAQEIGLDLVEVSPLAKPPVVKIVDYAKLKYQEEKERRKEKSKQKKIEVKGIRLSLRIGEHDTDVRMTQAKNFLEDGDKVRVDLILRGRERQHTELAKSIMHKFVEKINQTLPVNLEQAVTIQGGKLSLVIGKK